MGTLITFYSYKGGVGRSMALANTGIVLAQWGYNILVVDFDLEAPGLENFFHRFLDLPAVRDRRGVVDFLCDYLNDKTDISPDFWKDDTIPIRLPKTPGRLELWIAGIQDENYFKNVRRLDFPELYSKKNAGPLIESLRTELKKKYDFVLVDSRTGLTDIGGICTIQLPDSIVLLFTKIGRASCRERVFQEV
jgi:cellulose biosynthesis protein BcsQ